MEKKKTHRAFKLKSSNIGNSMT